MATYKDEIFWDDLTPEAQKRLFPFNNGNSCSIDELNIEIELNDDNLLFTHDDSNVYFDDDITEKYLVESDGEIEGFYDTKFKAIAEVTMKTQIGDLICGAFKLFTNPDRDYTNLPLRPDGSCFSSPNPECEKIWDKVINENPDKMTILLFNQKIELTKHFNDNYKNFYYLGDIKTDILKKFQLPECKDLVKKQNPCIHISEANFVLISNGKNDAKYICPSFITII